MDILTELNTRFEGYRLREHFERIDPFPKSDSPYYEPFDLGVFWTTRAEESGRISTQNAENLLNFAKRFNGTMPMNDVYSMSNGDYFEWLIVFNKQDSESKPEQPGIDLDDL